MSFLTNESLDELNNIIEYYERQRRSNNRFSKIGDFWVDDEGQWWICNKIWNGEPIYTKLNAA